MSSSNSESAVPPGRPGLLRRTGRFLWYLFAGAVVLAAVLFSLLRLAVAVAPDYREELAARLSEAVGQELRIGGFRTQMRGLHLNLVLEDVRLGPRERPGLELGELYLQLDVTESLRHRDLRLAEILVEGLELTVQRDSEGRFQLVGAGPRGLHPSAVEAVDDLLLQPVTLLLRDSRLRLLDLERRQTRSFSDLELRLVNLDHGRRQLAGRLSGPEDWLQELAFIAEWGGDGVSALEQAPIRYYAKARGMRSAVIRELFAGKAQPPYVAGSGDLEIWGTLEGGVPGVTSPSPEGRLAGSMYVLAEHGELELPRLFRGPLPHDWLSVSARWRLDDEGWQVDVDDARGSNEDGFVTGRVRVARRHGEAPFLDIRARASGVPGNARNTSRYLPSHIMPRPLVDWLDHAIVSGTAPEADVLFFGHADAFPFDNGDGVFRVEAETRDVTLAFWPEWPAVQALDGRLLFNGREMRIQADAGTIGGARALEAEAHIPVLGRTPLTINGRFEGAGDDFLRFLIDMPVTGDAIDRVLTPLRLDGEHGLELSLMIPFEGRPVELQGTVDLRDGVFRWPDRELAVESLRGQVFFDHTGINGENLTGRLGDATVSVDASTYGVPGGTRIQLDGRLRDLPAERLAEQFPALDFLQGRSDFDMRVGLPGFLGDPGETPVTVAVTSDLVGMRSTLPEPAAKDASEALSFNLELGVGERIRPIRFRAGDRLSGVLALAADGAPERLGIALGGLEAELPELAGVDVRGHAARTALDGWLAVAGEAVDEAKEETPFRLNRLDVTTDVLLLAGLELPDVAVSLRRVDRNWTLVLDGDSVAGNGELLQTGSGPLVRASLNHLRIPRWPERSQQADEALEHRTHDPGRWPVVDLRVEQLHFGNIELGHLRARGEPRDRGYRLERLQLDGGPMRVRAEGEWRTGADQHTRFQYTLDADDLGRASTVLGQPGQVEGGRGSASGDLSWAGPPWGYGLETLDGHLQMELRDGRLVQVEPGAGRLVGLLNVALLPRRLMLNFSDVVDQGFAFDVIRADLELEQGIVEPRELMMAGPSARVDVQGQLDLVKGHYDQVLVVAPRTSGALPLIGGLFGGPPAAAVLLMTQQLFRDTLDQAVALRYRITGPFSAPVIERMQRSIPDAGDPASDPTG